MILEPFGGNIKHKLSRIFFTEEWIIVNRLLILLKSIIHPNARLSVKLNTTSNKNVQLFQKLENNKNLYLSYS